MNSPKIRLSPQDFEAACQRTDLDPSGAATRGARLVLILGMVPARAAIAVGCSRQAVYAARCRILDSLTVCPTCGQPNEGRAGPRWAWR